MIKNNNVVSRAVELTEGIYIETTIARENHAALRSGFAGYPSNPRWTVRKYRAWKQGRQWRQCLNEGSMTLHNQHLITTEDAIKAAIVTPEPTPSSWRSPFKKIAFSLN